MEYKKTYTITTELFGTVTGTEEQLEELSFAANAQAVHYSHLMKKDPGERVWEKMWFNYSCTSSDIWKKLQEAKDGSK